MKKGPPYAKQLRERTEVPFGEVLVYAGVRAWDQAQAVLPLRAALVYEHDKGLAPSEYDWTCVRGLEVTILHSGGVHESDLDQLAVACVQSGATVARVVSPRAKNYLRRFTPEARAHV